MNVLPSRPRWPQLALGGALTAALGAVIFFSVLPDHFEVERSAVVRGSADQVTRKIAHFPERLEWVVWTAQDPEARYAFDGTPTQPGATMAWEGTEIGTAKLTLLTVDPGRRITTELDYDAPFDMVSQDTFELEALDAHRTRVTWRASGDLPWGPDRLFSLFAEDALGPDYAEGLARLDQLLSREST